MNDRLLKESDVIEAFKGRESLIHDVYTATAIIKSVPTADRPQGEWIPCEERLPEADGLYLATFTLIGIPKFSNVESFKNGKWEYHNGYIIAWQPLPKPWKGANDED